MKLKAIIISGLLVFSLILNAQERYKEKQNYIALKTASTQIKDQVNYGLVHRGVQVSGEYTHALISEKNTLSYSAELGLGMNGRKGVGLNMDIKPVDLYYGFNINVFNTLDLVIGPYFATSYQWYLYPELQSGHMQWLSSYEIGPRIMVSIPLDNRRIDVSVSNSTAGLSSRPEFHAEHYNYSLSMVDFITNPSKGLILAFQDKFNHYEMTVKLVDFSRKLNLAYEMEVFDFRPEPAMKRINHSIKLEWRISNNSK